MLAFLLMIVIAGCGSGGSISKKIALDRAANASGVVRPERSDAKLMTWEEWKRGSGERGGRVPEPSAGHLVWVIALVGRVTHIPEQPGSQAVVVVLDAISGQPLLEIVGPGAWPVYWEKLLNRSKQ
jgi:hypothetical protein